VDPFKQGFAHKGGSIDLNKVRLCFQVFLKANGTLIPLPPVVSKVIKDRKAYSDVQIVDYSDDTSPLEGGKKILLFCEKVMRDDIEVHFTQFTKSNEMVVAKGELTPVGVHKQYGISLKTPPYINRDISQPVRCSMYIYKPKSGEQSEPVDFFYCPAEATQQANLPQLDGLNAVSPADIKPVKRGRAPKTNQDDPSSGQMIVPTKVNTAQTRSSGGNVAPLASPGNNLNYSPQHQQHQAQQRSPYEQVQVAYDQGGSPRLTLQPIPPGPSPPAAVPVPNVEGGGERVNQITQELQDLLRGDQNTGQSQGGTFAEAGMSHLNAYLNSGQMQQQQQQQQQQQFVANLEGNNSLPQLSLSGDLPMPDVNNLSANLSSNLKIGKDGGKVRNDGGAQQQQGN